MLLPLARQGGLSSLAGLAAPQWLGWLSEDVGTFLLELQSVGTRNSLFTVVC